MTPTKSRFLRRSLGCFLALTIVFFLTVSSQTPSVRSAPSEQVIFSGIGFAETGDWQGPVGFWIWCQDEGNGPYGQAHACAGAMYVYAQGITVHVDGQVSEEQDETYTMDVFSRKEGVLEATLHNLSEDLQNGPRNDVEFTVTTDAGTASGVSNTSVVLVTGPGD